MLLGGNPLQGEIQNGFLVCSVHGLGVGQLSFEFVMTCWSSECRTSEAGSSTTEAAVAFWELASKEEIWVQVTINWELRLTMVHLSVVVMTWATES